MLSAVVEVPALADDDTEDISVAAELSNPAVTADLAHFMEHLLTPRTKVGIAAFVLFALLFRKRVRIWYSDQSDEIVSRHAPWAVEYVTESTTVQVVACKLQEGGRLRKCDPDLHGQDMNHWVGAWPLDEALPVVAEAFLDEEDEETIRHYRLHGLQIERTDGCNDCGIDTMSLMLGEERSLENRTEIRRKLVQFLKDHRGNRALISMLFEVGELQHHFGLHDLESAAEELFTHRCRGVEPAEQRSEIAVPESRHLTDEEIDAWRVRQMKRKSRKLQEEYQKAVALQKQLAKEKYALQKQLANLVRSESALKPLSRR
jgi:hypothetical protein